MSAIELKLEIVETSDLKLQLLRVQNKTRDGILSPIDLQTIVVPKGLSGSTGVVIEGKVPIWVYAFLVHQCHATIWVGCYDPRFSGAVVVESHTKGITVGDIIRFPLPI